jgi:U4/U6.U5 tri-snRNP component SNU23
MSSKLPYKQAANVERRTWDKEKYEAKARARNQAEDETTSSSSSSLRIAGQKRSLAETNINDHGHGNDDDDKEEFKPAQQGRSGPMFSKRAFLKSRTSKIDLESKVGTSELINPEEAAKSSIQITDGVTKVGGVGGVGWYCKVCDCYLKDSLTYLDHINGRKHQRALGYSMRTEKSTTKEVSSRLQALVEAKKKKEKDEEREFMISTRKDDNNDDEQMNEFEKIVKQKDEEVANRKAERAKRREERKKKAREEKEKAEAQAAQQINGCNDDEAEDEDDNQLGGLDPDMARMMGFSSFGCA